MGIYNLGGGGSGTSELQAKEATPLITNAQQIILPDEGYDGLSKVTVNPMPDGALKTPTVNSIGYVSSGVQTAGYFDTSATSGLQLSTQAAKTITPTTYSQTAVASGKYTTGAVTVGAVSLQSKTVSPSTSSQTIRADSGYTGLSSVVMDAARLQDKTVTPSTTVQYISHDVGYYGLGTVTIDKLLTVEAVTILSYSSYSPVSQWGSDLRLSIQSISGTRIMACAVCVPYLNARGTYEAINAFYCVGVQAYTGVSVVDQNPIVIYSDSMVIRVPFEYDSNITWGGLPVRGFVVYY